MKNTINFDDKGALWEKNYPGQFPVDMPIWLKIDMTDMTIWAETRDYRITGTPMDEWSGHILSYELPSNVDAVSLGPWVDSEIMPLAERVEAGYERVWNGNNHVPKFSDDASDAIAEIEAIFSRDQYNSPNAVPIVEGGGLWDAEDWFRESMCYDWNAYTCALCGDGDYVVTTETTDKQAAEWGDELTSAAESDGSYVEGIGAFIKNVRDHLIERRADEKDDDD